MADKKWDAPRNGAGIVIPKYNPQQYNLCIYFSDLIEDIKKKIPDIDKPIKKKIVLPPGGAIPNAPSRSNSHAPPSSVTDTNGLVSSMASRLSQLEAAHRKMREEVIEKEKELMSYKRKVAALEAQLKANNLSTEEVASYETLMKENFRLRKQVSDMEKFLNDYGLIWVGDKRKEEEISNNNNKNPDDFPIDFKLLFKRFNDLNLVAGAGKPKMKKEGNQAKFVFEEAIPIRIYKNGILIRRGPFRPYTDKSTQRFITDILDGYFPYEYKKSHPDGVAFDIDNRSTEIYEQSPTDAALNDEGEGQRLGNKSDNNNNNNNRNIRSLANMGDKDLKMTREEFLSRLPPTAIKDGQIIDVRDSIAKHLKGGGSGGNSSDSKDNNNSSSTDSPKPIATGAEDGMIILPSQALSDIQNDCVKKDQQITTLRIKSGDGKQTLMLKLYYSSTIGDIRDALDKYRIDNTTPYELRTAFPNKAYTDNNMTVKDADLVPNAKMFIKNKEEVGK